MLGDAYYRGNWRAQGESTIGIANDEETYWIQNRQREVVEQGCQNGSESIMSTYIPFIRLHLHHAYILTEYNYVAYKGTIGL